MCHWIQLYMENSAVNNTNSKLSFSFFNMYNLLIFFRTKSNLQQKMLRYRNEVIVILLILKRRNFTSFKPFSPLFFPLSFTCWLDRKWFGRHKMMLRVSPAPLKCHIITVLLLFFFSSQCYLFSLTTEVLKQSLKWLYEL